MSEKVHVFVVDNIMHLAILQLRRRYLTLAFRSTALYTINQDYVWFVTDELEFYPRPFKLVTGSLESVTVNIYLVVRRAHLMRNEEKR
ncbi:hypothetical protein RvY_11497-3 [Ramazzottius varieornatus]|nr:hypothetical protein RvY_11497-3 [Ramazzottius varieornatus]